MNTETNKFQRAGARSNAHAGSDFEEVVKACFARKGMVLSRNFAAPIGYTRKKSHRFDLGSEIPPVLIECKSCTWTVGGNTPSAKLRSFNEAMLHFSIAPAGYRKLLVLMKDMRGSESLGSYYVRTQGHLVPDDVEVWEIDVVTMTAESLLPS